MKTNCGLMMLLNCGSLACAAVAECYLCDTAIVWNLARQSHPNSSALVWFDQLLLQIPHITLCSANDC